MTRTPPISDSNALVVSDAQPQLYTHPRFTYALTIDQPSHQANDQKIEHPIILIHGIPGSDRDFKYLAPLLGQSHPCIRITLPGFGILAGQGPNLSQLDDRAHYLSEIARHQQWKSYILVGHSMGGASILSWGMHDAHVKGLVFINSIGLQRHRGMRYSQQQTRWALYMSYVPFWGKKLLQHTRSTLLKAGFKGEPFDHQQIRLIFQYIIHLNFDKIKEYTAKTSHKSLCVWSEDDHLIEDEISHTFAQSLANQQSIVYASGGHNVQKYQAPALAQAILDFAMSI